MRFQTILLSTSVLCMAQPIWAQTEDIGADSSASDATIIIVTASRSEQPLSQTGQSISVIDLEQIERTQSVTVADLLRNVPGVTLNRNGGIGTSTSVNIRGAGSDQTVALIDGVKLNGPSSPGSGFNCGN